jgi:hypothetical protein
MIAVFAAVLLTLAAVGANAWLLHANRARVILTTQPPRVVQNFVGALSANRPAIAHKLVDDGAQADLTTERLRAFASELRARHGDFRFAEATEQSRQDHESSVRATLRTTRSGRIPLTCRLVRDPATQIWKIAGM